MTAISLVSVFILFMVGAQADPDPVGACYFDLPKEEHCILRNEKVCFSLHGKWAGPFTKCQ